MASALTYTSILFLGIAIVEQHQGIDPGYRRLHVWVSEMLSLAICCAC